MLQWLQSNSVILTWLSSASLLMLVASLVFLPILLVRIPADYFLHHKALPVVLKPRSHLAQISLKILRNGAGLIFLLAGLAMLVLPGPGLVAIMVGVMLVELPGKFRFEAWLVRRKTVHRPINWIRARRGLTPLQLPQKATRRARHDGAGA